MLRVMHGKQVLNAIVRWFDTGGSPAAVDKNLDKVDWLRLAPFVGLHLLCFGVIWVGFSWGALAVAGGLYFVRMFAITGFYHRYFSHRAFRTGRVRQFLFGVLGNTAGSPGAMTLLHTISSCARTGSGPGPGRRAHCSL
jgi:stearoyl-CoA desaturase (delta-9 desaturase)